MRFGLIHDGLSRMVNMGVLEWMTRWQLAHGNATSSSLVSRG